MKVCVKIPFSCERVSSETHGRKVRAVQAAADLSRARSCTGLDKVHGCADADHSQREAGNAKSETQYAETIRVT